MQFILSPISQGTEFAQKNVLKVLANALLTKFVGLAGRQLRFEAGAEDGGPARDYSDKLKATAAAHAVLSAEIAKLNPTQWDEPMTMDHLLDFMTREGQPLDTKMLEAARTQFNMSDEDIQRMIGMQQGSEQSMLAEQAPAIKRMFAEMSKEPGSTEALDDIDWINMLSKANAKLKARTEQLVARGLQQRKNGLLTWAAEIDTLRKLAVVTLGEQLMDANADLIKKIEGKGVTIGSFD